jgi:tRNA(fMet)-specific endonuclease VapC
MAQASERHVTMLVLDTNHIVELGYRSECGCRLMDRLAKAQLSNATTIVCAEEQFRGWTAELNRATDPHKQIVLYQRLHERITFYGSWMILDWDTEAADIFVKPRKERVRIGTQDLKIACITLAHDATLLTRNLGDFRQVPGLRVENWLD